MERRDAHRLGYRQVDADDDVPVLFDAMDETARWPATVALRSWEQHQLNLDVGERLLDVGCGLGDAALALAGVLGPSGALVGIDVSASMLEVARQRAVTATCPVRFSVGDALHLGEPDQSFDAARCERTLQWLADPQAAVTELARVLRPGGRLCLIDTDWSTLRLDVADPEISTRVSEAMRHERGRASNVGSRLEALVRAAGLEPVARTEATHMWTRWDPDAAPAPAGCFSMSSMADDLLATGQLEHGESQRFVDAVHEAARANRFSMSLTMFAIAAILPRASDRSDDRPQVR
jgi:SAM-dependent methyltransferase